MPAEFPSIKKKPVDLMECDDPEVVNLDLEVDAAAFAEIKKQIESAILSVTSAGTDGVLDKLSVILTGDAASVTIPAIVDAVVKGVGALKARCTTKFYATKCCPVVDAEIHRMDSPCGPWTVHAVKIEAKWDDPVPAKEIDCTCKGGAKGKQKSQTFMLNWIITLAVDKFNFSYPFIAQIDKITVTSPCCCPLEGESESAAPPKEETSKSKPKNKHAPKTK